MTFSLLPRQPRKLLSLGACHHYALNAAMPDRVRDALRSASWTCHVCGAYLPGFLEIDHFDNHEPGSHGPIAPICQFCHDLKHPLWAVARDRMVPVMISPEISQSTLTRLCWLIISYSLHWPDTERHMQNLIRKLRCREPAYDGVIDTCHIADLFESLLGVVDFDGVEDAEEMAQFLDAKIRFLPSAVIDISVLRTFSVRGYVPVRQAVLRKATRKPFSRCEIDALLSRFVFLKEGPDGDAQGDSDGAASCDSDCRPDCDAGGDTGSPSARTANMDAAPSHRERRRRTLPIRAAARKARRRPHPNLTRKSNHEGIES